MTRQHHPAVRRRGPTLLAAILCAVAGCGRSVSTVDPALADGASLGDRSQAELVALELEPPVLDLALGTAGRLRATGVYADGQSADLTDAAAWSSDAEQVATVERGLVTAVTAGEARVTARAAGLAAAALVTVRALTVQRLFVAPGEAVTGVGGTVRFTATALRSDGSEQDVTTVAAWSAEDPGVAEVSPSGEARGLAPGATTIVVRLGELSAEARLRVTEADLVSITVVPANPTVGVGTRLRFSAQGVFADGSVADVTRSAAWRSSDASVLAVDPSGAAWAAAAGTANVSATIVAPDGATSVTGNSIVTVTPAALVSIEVTGPAASLAPGASMQLAARGLYADGTQADLTSTALWASSDTSVAAVSNAPGARGVVTGLTSGTATITATVGAASGSRALTVTNAEPQLVQVVVSPVAPSVLVGQPVQFAATAIWSDHSSRDVTRQAQWASGNPAVARPVTGGGPAGNRAAGRFETLSAGTATITATFDGVPGTATLTVTDAVVTALTVMPAAWTLAVGDAQRFFATAIYSDNTAREVTLQASWSSSDPNVAHVEPGGGGGAAGRAGGLVTALAPGTATITATYQGISGSATVTVSAAKLVSVVIFPTQWSLAPGTIQPLTAEAIYSDNTAREITNLATWLSSDPAVAAVSMGGLPFGGRRGVVTALAPGVVTISATYEGLTANATITVTAATITAIQVWPAAPQLGTGLWVPFSAEAIYSDNTSREVTGQASWTSSDQAVATIGNTATISGLAQTLSPGTTTITATYQGASGSTTLTVLDAQLAAIQLTPASPTLPVGFIAQLKATGIFSDNTSLDLSYLVSWTSSDPSVVAVGNSSYAAGLITPLAAGTATISASYAGVSGSTPVYVTDATLQSIAVTPAAATVAVGGYQPFVAMGSFSDGRTFNVTPYVTWLSSDEGVAAVSNAAGSRGLAKGLAPGTVTITAVRDTAQGTGTLVVQ